MLHDEDIDERGFVCTLDEEPGGDPISMILVASPVTGVNPFTGNEEFNNLYPGDHTFEVTAFIVINEGPDI